MENIDALLVDAGTGNLHSVHNALMTLGFRVQVTSDPNALTRRGRVILPGVGAFGSFMQGLREKGLEEPLREAVRRGDPVLGICVGMQALFQVSEELGQHSGLCLLDGRVVRFPDFADRKVPHTGWNQLWFGKDAALFQGMENGSYAYFNHSYYCSAQPDDTSASTDYGLDFASSVQRENLYGVQFHPEKSQRVGQTVLANFFRV